MSQKQSTINGNSLQYQYQYDNAGRLTREQMGDSITSYTYDSYNNRAGMNADGVQYNYIYDANNRLIKQSKAVGENTEITDYGYDSNGNLIAEFDSVVSPASGEESRLQIGVMGADADGARLYSYDAYNRLKTYTNGVTNASYTYDGNNLRQSKTVDGVTTNHIWDGANMVMEIKGTTVNKYYRGATGLIYSDIDGERRYYHKDEHGNVAAMTNAAGNVINVNTYDAFGNMTQTNESITDPFGYCCEYYDTELDALYLRNRYYSPSIGRFITEDPIKDGLNWYAYANNNPIMFVDTLGLLSEIEAHGDVIIGDKKYSDVLITMANVPIQNQLDEPYGGHLCWATCASMLISYYRGENVSRATDIAIAVARYEEEMEKKYDDTDEMQNAELPKIYNVPRPWYSTDFIGTLLGLDISKGQTQYYPRCVLSESDIMNQIDNDNPFAILYGVYVKKPGEGEKLYDGHWCLGIGYLKSLDENNKTTLYIRNDPWGGIRECLTYDEINKYGSTYWAETAY